MANIFFCATYLLSLQYVLSQVIDETASDYSTRRKKSDPVSAFFSELGDLLLNIDETYSRQTAPKVNAEDRMKEQIYGRPRQGPGYFERIRQNYKDIQKRVGESLGMLDLRLLSNLGSVNVQSKGSKSVVDVSLPFLPMKLSLNSKQILEDTTQAGDLIKVSKTDPENLPEQQNDPHYATNDKGDNEEIIAKSSFATTLPSTISKGIEHFNDQINPIQQFTIPPGIHHQAQSEMENLNRDLNEEDSSDIVDEEFLPRMGRGFEPTEPSVTEDSTITGRVLGDVLYSESTFDKIMKRVMKDKKWVIDSDSIPLRMAEKVRRASEKISEPIDEKRVVKNDIRKPEAPIGINRNKDEKFDRPVRSNFKKRQSLQSSNNNVEELRKHKTETKMDLNPQLVESRLRIPSNSPNVFPKESVILAFTPDGVPLKLRMGPEITNPLKFLHKVLSTYDVSLNIPVGSYDNINPVGREILQLGTGNGGTMTRALYINLSDKFQLDSLLRTLRLSKLEHLETQ